jgi:hypothetical protein
MRNLILTALILASFGNLTRTYSTTLTYSFSGVMQGNEIFAENTEFVGSFTYELTQNFSASGSYMLQSYEITFLADPLPIPEGPLILGRGSWNGAFPNNGSPSIGVSNSTEDVFSVTLSRIYSADIRPGRLKLGGPRLTFFDSTGSIFSDTSLPNLSSVVVPFTSGQISISYDIDAGSRANQTGIIFIPEPPSLQDGEWTYIIENGGATIKASTATGAVTIPRQLGGYPVIKVGNGWPPIFGQGNNSVTTLDIPNRVTSIGTHAFAGCTGLTTLTIPNSVTSIGEYAFANCTGLTTLTIPNSVTSIERGAFGTCTGLTTIVIGSGVTSIGMNVFANCTGLTTLIIPNSVTSIGWGAFTTCTGLTTLTIPNSVTSIVDWAFANCTGLTSIVIGSGVTSIGEWAFVNCTSLPSVTIPNTVVSIGANAFRGCTSLTQAVLPTHLESAFADFGLSASQAYFLRSQAELTLLDTTSFNSGRTAGRADVTNSPSSYSLYTATQYSGNYTTGYNSGRTAGRADVTTNPATYSLYTATQYNANFATGFLTGQQSILFSPNIYNLYTAQQYANSFTAGKDSVLNSPNSNGLYTTSQIHYMAMGDLVLTRQEDGIFVLNYDIDQSTDLQTWTTYAPLSLPLTGLPTDKAFVRIKAKQ